MVHKTIWNHNKIYHQHIINVGQKIYIGFWLTLEICIHEKVEWACIKKRKTSMKNVFSMVTFIPKSQIWQTCTNVLFQGYWNGDKLRKLVNLNSNSRKQNPWTWNLSTWVECPCSKGKVSNLTKSTLMRCLHVESYFKCSTSYKCSSNFLQAWKKTYHSSPHWHSFLEDAKECMLISP